MVVVMSIRSVNVAMCQFFGIGVAYFYDFAAEEEVNTGHGVVEIQFNLVQSNPGDHTLQAIALLILQGQYVAYLQQAIRNFSFVFKNMLWDFYQCVCIVFAISLGGRNAKSEAVACFHAREILFKIGDHHTDPIDKGQGLLPLCAFNKLSLCRTLC